MNELNYDKYNLKWRNLIVEGVDWENHYIKYKFVDKVMFDTDNHYFEPSFDKIWKYIDSSDDVQAIKMIMDRLFLLGFCLDEGSATFRLKIIEYVKDVILNPYEDLYECDIKNLMEEES